MCGIFGYVGPKAGASLLMEGIKRLEYRGYDSWGISLGVEGLDPKGALHTRKEVGSITQSDSLDAGTTTGQKGERFWGGIAHTRWATHGVPSVVNAHPHLDCTDTIAVVHNGIIENYAALKERLKKTGHKFKSETDSEVIAHLIEEFVSEGLSLSRAVLDTLKLLEGTYGLAVIRAQETGIIIAARKGSPMVIGVGESETLLASDPAALVSFTKNVIYLEDGEMAVLRADRFETHDLNAVPIDKRVEEIAFELPAIERSGYTHFMLKEIFEQPVTIKNALRGRLIRSEGTAKLGGLDDRILRSAKRCHIIACGTSWHAGLIGKYLLENISRIPTQVSYAAEFRYANPMIEPDTLVIALSQSGETTDTLEGVREAILHGAATIGICNVVGSSIARECSQGIYLHAGPEIGVASTKAFTSQLVVLALLALHLGRMRGMSLGDALRFLDTLERLPEQAEEVLEGNEIIRQIAAAYSKSANFLYIGRLYEYPVALEGALKLKEISYIHAEGIPAAELKHGPIALIDSQMPIVVLCAQQNIKQKMMGNIQEIKARGGKMLAVSSSKESDIFKIAEHTIVIPSTTDPLVPILSVIPLQLLAYHIAVERGCNVDKPRNLAKSVTVE